jgi:hypothetical protein
MEKYGMEEQHIEVVIEDGTQPFTSTLIPQKQEGQNRNWRWLINLTYLYNFQGWKNSGMRMTFSQFIPTSQLYFGTCKKLACMSHQMTLCS